MGLCVSDLYCYLVIFFVISVVFSVINEKKKNKQIELISPQILSNSRSVQDVFQLTVVTKLMKDFIWF